MGILVKNYLVTKQAFLLPSGTDTISEAMRAAKVTPYSYDNVDDTTMGGNWVINPPPQYTKFADIKERRRAVMPGSRGMGRGYSESINSFKEVATFRFGKPRFTGASIFFSDFYSAEMGVLVKSGRDPGILWNAAQAYTTVLSYLTPLPYLYMVGRAGRWFLGKPTSQYYYMVPTMHIYWSVFQTLANEAAVNMGLITGLAKSDKYVEEGGTVRHQFDFGDDYQEFINYASKAMPGIFKKGGGLDIYQIATRRQRIQNAWAYRVQQMMTQDYNSYENFWKELDSQLDGGSYPVDVEGRTMQEYLQATSKSNMYSAKQEDSDQTLDDMIFGRSAYPGGGNTPVMPAASATASDGGLNQAGTANKTTETTADIGGQGIGQADPGQEATFLELMDAELADGGQFISYKVDRISTVGEGFNNNAADSSVAQAMNSRAQANIEKRFTLSGGQTGFALIDGVTQAAAAVINGGIAGFGLDGIVGAFMGSGFAEIPKFYSGSSANLPKADLTMELRAWSGDRWTIYNSLLVPLFGILAGALPQMTGKSSYGQPFMCECYVPGKFQITRGMIDSVQVTRHTGNVGSTREGLPLGIDITVSVMDMSSILSVPVMSSGASVSKLDPRRFLSDLLADDTPLNSYMAVLTALTLTEQVYMTPDLSRRWNRKMEDINSFWSKGNFASYVSDTMPGRIASGLLWKRTERPF